MKRLANVFGFEIIPKYAVEQLVTIFAVSVAVIHGFIKQRVHVVANRYYCDDSLFSSYKPRIS